MFVSSTMTREFRTVLISMIIALASTSATAEEQTAENKVLHIAQKMTSAFQKMEDYTCEVEQIYHGEGIGDRYHRFKYYFKKGKKIRIDFSQPYPGTTVLYSQDSNKATVIPFQIFPALRFHFSIKNPMVMSMAGQRIDQTDMGYFIDFLLQNLKKVKQKDHQFQEDEESATFLLWALDYINGKRVEKYKVVISKKNWLPIFIERYDGEGNPMETIHVKNYTINTHLDDRLFNP
jgi:outer membrane lipoprotein-sorting protein